MDEPALFLRAVAANMQAGKKVRRVSHCSHRDVCHVTLLPFTQDIEVPIDAQHIREAFRRLMEGEKNDICY